MVYENYFIEFFEKLFKNQNQKSKSKIKIKNQNQKSKSKIKIKNQKIKNSKIQIKNYFLLKFCDEGISDLFVQER